MGQHETTAVVPGAGVEPASSCERGILSPLRLPVSPPGHASFVSVQAHKDKKKARLCAFLLFFTTSGATFPCQENDDFLF